MTALGLLMCGAGVVLIFAAYRDVSPIALVTATLTGNVASPGGAAGAIPAPKPPNGSGSKSGLGGGGKVGGGGGGGSGGSW